MRFAILKVFGRVIFFCEERKDFEKKKDERRKTDDDAMDIIKKWRRKFSNSKVKVEIKIITSHPHSVQCKCK